MSDGTRSAGPGARCELALMPFLIEAGTMGGMRFILNVLWLIFGSGIVLAIGYGLAALVCFVLIVTIPFGVASMRLAVYSLWPFGRTLVAKPDAGLGAGVANVIWVVLAGWWLALMHIVAGIGLCVTIIGIPFGIANFKLVPAAFWPLGREVVEIADLRPVMGGPVVR